MSEKIILTKKGCPSCELIEEYLNEVGLIDRFKFVDVSEPENAEWVKEMGIKDVPDCAVIERGPDGTKVRKCTEQEWRDVKEGK